MAPVLAAGMLAAPMRGLARKQAALSNLEGRSKLGYGTAREIDKLTPHLSGITSEFDDLLWGLHRAEGRLLDYDQLKEGRLNLERRFKDMDSETESVLNARLGGSTTAWPATSRIPHSELDQLQSFLEREQVYMGKMEDEEFARVGLNAPGNLDVSREMHPKFLSSTGRNPFAQLQNVATIIGSAVKQNWRPGLKPANAGRMASAINDWIDGNASWDGQKVVWREGKGRGWWKGGAGIDHGVTYNGKILTPETISSAEEFFHWKIAEPMRLADALVRDWSKLGESSERLDDGLEKVLKLPHLGEIVHNVSVIDQLRAIERRRRTVDAIAQLPDGYFDRLESLRNNIEMEMANIGNNFRSVKDPKGQAALLELRDHLETLEGLIGKNVKGEPGSLTGDAFEIVGRPLTKDPGAAAQFFEDIDAQLADYMNKVYIKYNLSSGLRQEGQALVAHLASVDGTGIKNYLLERGKALPLANLLGIEGPKVLENTHNVVDRTSGAGWNLASWVRRQARLQANSTEQIEASTISGFMRSLQEKAFSPEKAHVEYLTRVLGRDGTDALRAALASGDSQRAFDLARPLLIRELDQRNGSNVSTSKPTIMKSNTALKLMSRMVSTPLVVTGSALGATDRYGANASSNPALAKARTLAILGAGQLLTNAGIIANPWIGTAMSTAMGSPLFGAWYAWRAGTNQNTEEELRAKGKIDTYKAVAKDAASGDLRSAAVLAAAGLLEALPTKMSSSSDLIYGERSSSASQMGMPSGGRPTDWVQKAAEFSPTTVGAPLMLSDLGKRIWDYGLMDGVFGKKSMFPIIRSIAPAGEVVSKGIRFQSKPLAPNVETVDPAKAVETKLDRQQLITTPR